MSSRQLPLFPDRSEHALTRHSALHDAIGPFLEHLRQQGRSPHTIDAFHSDLKLVIEFFGDTFALGDVTTSKLSHFM